ncbi:MAG: hypothetical protein ACR2GY_11950 [Phycisphaerales bacterium]
MFINPVSFVHATAVMLLAASVMMTSCKKTEQPTREGDVFVVDDDDADDRTGTIEDRGTRSGTSDAEERRNDNANRDGVAEFSWLLATLPPEWESQTPSSSMRVLQMRVPAGDDQPAAGDATLVAFGGIGGSVDANIQRWVGQFTAEDGSAVEPNIETRNINGLAVTIATLTGTYDGGAMSATDSGTGRTMIQAIVVRPDGEQIFIRLLGPTATVLAHRDAFDAMLSSLEF